MSAQTQIWKSFDDTRQQMLDNIYWTRLLIEEAASKYPGIDATLRRLSNNHEQLGKTLSVIYDKKAGEQFTNLLKDNAAQAKTFIDAALSDQNVVPQYQMWSLSGQKTADFLASINKYVDQEKVRAFVQNNIDATLAQVGAILKSDWDGSVAAFDKLEKSNDQLINYYLDQTRKYAIKKRLISKKSGTRK